MGSYYPPLFKRIGIEQLVDLKPESTYYIILEKPAQHTTLVMKADKAIRPGFTYISTPASAWQLKLKPDVEVSPTASHTVVAI